MDLEEEEGAFAVTSHLFADCREAMLFHLQPDEPFDSVVAWHGTAWRRQGR